MRSTFRTLSLFLLALIAQMGVNGQDRAAITGTLLDSQGGSIPQAQVEVRNEATGVVTPTTTNDTGYFEVPFLVPGTYSITVDATGFKKLVRQSVTVSIGVRLQLELRMEIGSVSDAVVVTASAPLIETTNASSGRILDKKEIEGLPIGQMNPLNVAALAPGIVSTMLSSSSRVDGYGSSAQIRTMGSLGQNEWSLDGVPVTGTTNRAGFTPNTDAVGEFKLETTSFDVQNGFSIGVAINMTTRGGGKQYHGSLYDQHNQQRWNAMPHFNRLAYDTGVAQGTISPSTPKQASGRQNNYGVNLGGPVRIPKLYDGTDKLFFYFTYNGIRQNTKAFAANATGLNFNVPETDWLTGDFSKLQALDPVKYTVYDPRSARLVDGRVVRSPFPNNKVPVLNPMAPFYQSIYPRANSIPGIVSPEGLNNYFAADLPAITVFNSVMNRFDYNVNTNHRLFAKWYYSRGDYDTNDWTYSTRPGLMSSAVVRTASGADFSYVWTLSHNTILTAGLGVTRYGEGSTNQQQTSIKPSDVGLPKYLDEAAGGLNVLPSIQFSGGLQSVNIPYPSVAYGTTGTLKFGLVTILSNHSLKYGWDERRYWFAAPATGYTAGSMTFNNAYMRATDASNTASNWGLEYAAFLMGIPGAITYTKPDSGYWSTPMRALYLQDDWRVTRRLNINLGLRFEYQGGQTERFNRGMVGAFDANAPMPYAAAAEAAYATSPIPELPASQFKVAGGIQYLGSQNRKFTNGTNHFLPRIGAAYQLRSSTVLRLGYGWYDDVFYANQLVRSNTSGFSQTTTPTISNDLGLTFCCGNTPASDPFPLRADGTRFNAPYRDSLGAAALSGSSFTSYVPNYSPARQQRWRVGIQHQFGKDMMAEVSYNGSYGWFPLNQAVNALPGSYYVTGNVRDITADNNLQQTIANPFYIGNLTSLQTSNPVLYDYLNTQPFFRSTNIRKGQLLAQFPHMAGVSGVRTDQTFASSRGKNIYRDIQARFEKRFGNGLQSAVMYTHASGASQDSYLNPYDDRPSWIASNFAPAHRFVWSSIYELPFGKGKKWANSNGFLNHLVGGWQTSVIYQYQTGAYSDIYLSGTVREWGNVFFYGDTKDLGRLFNHDEINSKDIHLWFDPSIAYRGSGAIPADFEGFDGRSNAQPGVYQARTFPGRITALPIDGMRNWDARVQKQFRFGERWRAEFSGDLLNLTNRTQFGGPEVNPTNLNFGRVSVQRNTPRFVQLMMRVTF